MGKKAKKKPKVYVTTFNYSRDKKGTWKKTGEWPEKIGNAATFEVSRDKGKRKHPWCWALRSRNGQITAHNEGYTRKASALRAVYQLTRTIRATLIKIVEVDK